MTEDRAPKRHPNYAKFHQPIYSAEHKAKQRQDRKPSAIAMRQVEEAHEAPYGRCEHGAPYVYEHGYDGSHLLVAHAALFMRGVGLCEKELECAPA